MFVQHSLTFPRRSLAIVALNADASFSVAEASAAKAELNQRTRSSVLNAFDPGAGGGLKASTQALLQQNSTMSAEEKKVLGFTDDFANRIMQNTARCRRCRTASAPAPG